MNTFEKYPILAGTSDPRVRRTLTPVRVMTTVGDVKGQDSLLIPQPPQVMLWTPGACLLKNGAEGEKAGVLVDFGIEVHGTVTVTVTGIKPKGGTIDIRIRTGESAAEALTPLGVKNTTNDHATRDLILPVSFYSANETPETGFRFAYVELVSDNASAEIASINATAILRDLEYIGSFDCSDPLLTKCYDTAAYTVHLNMQRFLWDGIKRDRLIWAGDMNTEVNTILAVFGGGCDVMTKSLDRIRDVTPPDQFMNGMAAYSLWWTLCHYDWYMGTGDKKYLMEQRDYLKALIPRYFDYIDENGSEALPNKFFDHPNQACHETRHAGLQGLMRYAFQGASELFRFMEEYDLSEQCLKNADRLLAHRPDPQGAKQPAAMLALSGIHDPGEMAEKVILPGGANGFSTFLGYYTLMAVAEAGLTPAALPLIRQYWGTMLDLGATTFWEDFDITWAENAHRIDELPVPGKKDPHGDCGAFCYKNFRHSLCHGWASGPAPFLTKYVLGIRPFAPGMKAVRFAPELGDLSWAKGTVPTPHGVITVELEKDKYGRTIGKIEKPDEVDVIVK